MSFTCDLFLMKKTVQKQILRYGEWKNPNAKNGVLSITRDYIQQLVDNFKHTPFVPVLRGHVANNDAEANTNLIISKNIQDLAMDDEGLNATFEVDEEELEKYNDVSASIDEAYENHETGDVIGATLKHIALVVDPYIKGLRNFALLKDKVNYLINLSEITMKKEKSKTELAEEPVKVEAEVVKTETTTETEPETEKVEETVEVATVVEPEAEAKEEPVKTEETVVEVKEETVDSAELQKTILDLQEQIKSRDAEIVSAKAQTRYIELRDAGKATPAMEDAVKSLYQSSSTVVNLADGCKKTTGELLDQLFEKMPQIISFGEQGVNTEAIDDEAEPQKVQLMEIWKKQNPSWSNEQLEAKYKKSASLIKEVVKKS